MSAIRSPILTALVLIALVLAGCLGSANDATPRAPEETDNGSRDPSTDGDGDTPSDDDGATGSDDEETEESSPRTPADAMDPDPAETGEGWARFDIQGTSAPNAQVSIVQAGTCPTGLAEGQSAPTGSQCTYTHNLTLQEDVVRVEVALTWNPGTTDLNLVVRDDNDAPAAQSNHGAEDIPGLLLVTPSNGTTWEYVDLVGPDDLGTGTWTVNVQEYNNLDTEAATSGGTPWTLQVWVYTVESDVQHHPGG